MHSTGASEARWAEKTRQKRVIRTYLSHLFVLVLLVLLFLVVLVIVHHGIRDHLALAFAGRRGGGGLSAVGRDSTRRVAQSLEQDEAEQEERTKERSRR